MSLTAMTSYSTDNDFKELLERKPVFKAPTADSIRPSEGDSSNGLEDTQTMNEITRTELSSTLSAIEERMDKRIDRMESEAEKRAQGFKAELSLRDDQIRRELDLRQESFRAEQAARDAALNEKFAGFLAAQTERDKAWEKISEARFDRIEKDVSSIKADTKKVSDDVSGIRVTMAKYLGAAVVIGAIASAILGAFARRLLA
ncbi:hypothetical protein ACLRDI_30575 [Pseudomonas piscis]|uniref:hypothetical protein n=1 Tax=Pseudomonas piscis TaxID=2614538 RepID=UPI0039A54BB1